MEYPIELFGAKPGGTFDCTAALQKAIDEAGNAGGGDIVIPRGKIYLAGRVTVTKPFIKVTGGGTLINATFHVGKPAPQPIPPGYKSEEYCFVLEDVVCRSSEPGTLNLFEGENAAVLLLKDLRVWHYDRVASIVPADPAGTAPNNVTWLMMDNIRYSEVNYLIYTDKLDSQRLPMNEFTISRCTGVAKICHIRMRGIDGLGVVDNNFLFPGYAERNMSKKSNIDIDYCQWVRINDNNLFEAGESGIKLAHFASVTVTGNTIGWCGQVTPSHGVHLLGGDLDGNNVCRATIGNNTIEFPTGSGIFAEGQVGDVGVADNKVYGAGNNRYYYGATDLGAVPHWAVYCADTTQNCVVADNSSIDAEFYTGLFNYSTGNIDSRQNISRTWRGKYVNDGLTTVSVRGCEYIKFNNPNTTTITNLVNGYPGQEITLYGMNGNTTIARNSSFALAVYVVGLDIPSGGSLRLQYIEGVWREIGRSWIPQERAKLIDSNTGLLDMNGSDRAELQMPSPYTVSLITAGVEGRVITLLGLNGNTTLMNTPYIKLRTGANTTIPADGLMRLEFMKGKWREIYRDF